jgi:hypothetical protein
VQKPLRGLFSQVFTAYPENIALDDKSLTYKQAVSARSDILSWLVKQELRELDQLGSVRKVLQKPLRRWSWYAGDWAITGSFGEDAHHDQEAG